MSSIKLSPTQTNVLKAAARRADGNIEPLPATLRGGARQKVIDGLLAKGLVGKFHYPDHTEYYLTDAGYAAVGRKRKAAAATVPIKEKPARAAPKKAAGAPESQAGVDHRSLLRKDTKQAIVIGMLQRPEGATVAQIMAATGWQAHTVRGTFAGAFKKRLGLNVVSEKTDGERTYRLA